MNDNSKKLSPVDTPKQSAEHYDEFYGPMFFEPYAIEVANRFDPSLVSVALEIAAGTGRVTRHIRKRIPASSRLIASDISDEMLGVAKEQLSDLDIDWQNINAQQLPFNDNSIDLIVCCFGYMFVPDKPKAFAEAYRVLKQGGVFLFTTWDKLEKNGASYTYLLAASKYYEGALSESNNVATSMNDETMIRRLLNHTGFSKMSIEKVGKESFCNTAKEAAIGFTRGGSVMEEIKKRNPASIDELTITVEKELSEKFGAAPMIAPISAVVAQAWK